jgi:PAS domain S-box-containing protein
LRQSEERYRLLVESVRDYAIFMLSPEGHILTWNAGAQRIKGYSADEIIGKHFSTFYPPEDVAWDKPGYELAVAVKEGRFEDEGWRVRKDGSRFWANVIITALLDSKGELQGFAKVTRDLTERRRTEEQARQLAAEQAARAEAEGANRRKDEFLALLGHELRNPLAPLRNAVQILSLSGGDPALVAQARDMIARQVTQMTRLVDELLDASRISRGKVQLRRERLDLAALVRATAADHQPELQEAGLTLTIEVPSAPLEVDGDPARLTQVLGNLLHNAGKFTDPGGRVTVRLMEEKGLVSLSVADTGIGITPEALPKLFEVFSQVEASIERSKGGLGVGLAVVKGLIELHGGRVRAASAGPGHGAVFTVTLPLAGGCLANAEATLSAPSESRIAPPPRRKVLIIEDGPDAAESLRLLLSLHGFEVTVAHTGPEGLALARRFLPDAVVCDLGLPGMSGHEVARALRADQTTASALLLCVSGYGQEQDRRQAREAGFDEILVKPPDTDALIRLLARPPAGWHGRESE